MNIFDRIKQLKLIVPDPMVAERSKREIFMTTRPVALPFRKMTVRQVLVRILEVGVATGLAAIFLLLITGGVAMSPLSPVPFASINPQALHAEAQAIDIQIKLTNLAYQTSRTLRTAGTSTPMNAVAEMSILGTGTAAGGATSTNATSSASSTLTVDQALNALSQ